MRLVFLVAVSACYFGALSSNANADQTVGFICDNLQGKSYYFEEPLNSPANLGWKDDEIMNGRTVVLIGPENGEGGAEVKFRDATGQLQSASSTGSVHFLGLDEALSTARVDVLYNDGRTTEHYVPHDLEKAVPSLVLTTVKIGPFVGRVSVLTAECSRL